MNRLLLAFALLALLTGCETIIDVELPAHEPRLVVNSLFAADSLWRVEVSQSQTIQNADPFIKDITNATVEIWQGGDLVDTLPYVEETDSVGSRVVVRSRGYRSADRRPRVGEAYTVRVQAPGFDPVEATGRVPEAVPFVLTTRRIDSPVYSRSVEATLTFTDPAEDTYYALAVYADVERVTLYPEPEEDLRDTTVVRQRFGFSSSEPVLRENAEFTEIIEDDETVYSPAVFSDAAISGRRTELTIRPRLFFNPERVRRLLVVLTTLSRDSYEYLLTQQQAEIAGDNPFAEPVQVFSNVENGLGIFAGMAPFERLITTTVDEGGYCPTC